MLFVVLYAAFRIAAETGQTGAVAVMMLGGAILAPWFWGSAMRFRFNATRWRGVRLQFTAGWDEVYRASLPAFVLALVAFGGITQVGVLAAQTPGPAALMIAVAMGAVVVAVLCAIKLGYNYQSLMVARGRIGGQTGRWKPQYGDFVRIWLATLGVFLAGLLLVAGGIARKRAIIAG